MQEGADDKDHHRARPDLPPPDRGVEEEPGVAGPEDRLDDLPAIEPWDWKQREGEDRKVQKDDRVDEVGDQVGGKSCRRADAGGIEGAEDKAEDDRREQAGRRAAEGKDQSLADRADAIGLYGHPSAPAGEENENRDRADRFEEAARVEREVAEVANGAIALEVGRRRVSHLVDRDRDQEGGYQEDRRQQECGEWAHIGVFTARRSFDRDFARVRGRAPA